MSPTATDHIPRWERALATVTQLAPLLTIWLVPVGPFAPVIVPGAVLYLRRHDAPFAASHARSALNLQISFILTLLALAISGAFALLARSALLAVSVSVALVALVAWWLTGTVAGAVRAHQGHPPRGRLAIKFFKDPATGQAEPA